MGVDVDVDVDVVVSFPRDEEEEEEEEEKKSGYITVGVSVARIAATTPAETQRPRTTPLVEAPPRGMWVWLWV